MAGLSLRADGRFLKHTTSLAIAVTADRLARTEQDTTRAVGEVVFNTTEWDRPNA